ncbi:MAG: MFS transporter [Eubacteriales bacterium]|nr:MFS transporter [Eubacteriales bacterium]
MADNNMPQMQKGELTGRQVNIYGSYLMFSSLAAMTQMMYMTIFLTDTVMIPAAVVASTLLIARFIDLIVGILSGGIIEKAKMKHGKYRSWLLLGRWLVIFGLVCCFFDTSAWPLGLKLGLALVGYLIVNITFSFLTNAYYALNPALAKGNMTDRFRLSSRGAQFMCVAMLLTSATTIPLVTFFCKVAGPGWGYLITALIFAIPLIPGIQMLNNITKECDPDGSAAAAGPTVTISDMIKSVVENKQMLVIFLSFTIYYIAIYIAQGLGTYYFTYLIGDFMKMSLSMTITMITGFFASLVVPKIGQKIGKKKSFVLSMLIYALIYVGMFLFAKSTWQMYTLMAVIGGGAIYMFTGFGPNYFIDCGEYYLYEKGKDMRNIAIALFSVPMKIGMMLGGAISVYGLAAIGYTPGIEVTDTFRTSFMILLGIIPAILLVISGLITLAGYKLTDEKAAFYAGENAKKMQEQMAKMDK